MMAMQQETKAVYAKYGVSPTGSCVQMLIQMPILFALYRVFMNVPAYVNQVKEAFFPDVYKRQHLGRLHHIMKEETKTECEADQSN